MWAEVLQIGLLRLTVFNI